MEGHWPILSSKSHCKLLLSNVEKLAGVCAFYVYKGEVLFERVVFNFLSQKSVKFRDFCRKLYESTMVQSVFFKSETLEFC